MNVIWIVLRLVIQSYNTMNGQTHPGEQSGFCEEIEKILGELELNEACYEGNIEAVKRLLDGTNHYACDEEAFNHACEKGYYDIVELLLQHGTDVHTGGGQNLCHACQEGNFDMVELLLKYGADVHVRNDQPLRDACEEGHLDIVSLLIGYGANVNVNDDEVIVNSYCLMFIDVVKFLVEQGANIFARDNLALQRATLYGYDETVKYIKSLIKEDLQFPKKPDDLVFNITEGAKCPITQEVLTKEMRKLGCSECKNVFDYNALTKWLNFGEGKKCPFRCDGSVFYEV